MELCTLQTFLGPTTALSAMPLVHSARLPVCTVCAAAVLLTRPPAFIEPFFSSGMHLAFTCALSTVATISSSIRGVTNEEEWHDTEVGTGT